MCPTDFQKLIADEGYVFAPNFAKKRKALAKTARRGDVAAQVALGVMYCHGLGVSQNLPEAATWFQMAADKRDREAQFLLGQMYWNGEGVPQDTELATKWLQKAAEQGDVDAQQLLQFISADAIQINLNRAMAAPLQGGEEKGATRQRQNCTADRKTSLVPFLARAAIGLNYSPNSAS
jgi:TPR repeat protein